MIQDRSQPTPAPDGLSQRLPVRGCGASSIQSTGQSPGEWLHLRIDPIPVSKGETGSVGRPWGHTRGRRPIRGPTRSNPAYGPASAHPASFGRGPPEVEVGLATGAMATGSPLLIRIRPIRFLDGCGSLVVSADSTRYVPIKPSTSARQGERGRRVHHSYYSQPIEHLRERRACRSRQLRGGASIDVSRETPLSVGPESFRSEHRALHRDAHPAGEPVVQRLDLREQLIPEATPGVEDGFRGKAQQRQTRV